MISLKEETGMFKLEDVVGYLKWLFDKGHLGERAFLRLCKLFRGRAMLQVGMIHQDDVVEILPESFVHCLIELCRQKHRRRRKSAKKGPIQTDSDALAVLMSLDIPECLLGEEFSADFPVYLRFRPTLDTDNFPVV